MLAYRLGARALRDAPTIQCTTLYAVGGMYGNTHALAAIRERAKLEDHPPAIVFNGDFNFFNVEPGWWRKLNETIRDSEHHFAIAGNVEVESADAESETCGCGYPSYISRALVQRSDNIVSSLRSAVAAARAPELVDWLLSLPKALIAEIGESRQRVGILHGDVESTVGWNLGVEAMWPPDCELRAFLGCDEASGFRHLPITPRSKLLEWFDVANVSGLLCSHTCLPYGQLVETTGDKEAGGTIRLAVFNNGSAGMPNFHCTRFGLITRVSADLAVPSDSLYGAEAGGLRFDALPVHYDNDAWLKQFRDFWPEGSPAYVSYHNRLVNGPNGFTVKNAARDLTTRYFVQEEEIKAALPRVPPQGTTYLDTNSLSSSC